MKEVYSKTEARIVLACQELQASENPNVAATAREFEVPESRLRGRWKGRQAKIERPPTNRKLSSEEEVAVCRYLKRLDEIGTSARPQMVTDCANSVLRRNHTSDNSNLPSPIVSSAWTHRFLERHSEFYIRKEKTLEQERKKAHDPDTILDWFRRFRRLCEEKGILLKDIYNFDETGFRVGVGRDQWIITLDPARQSYSPSTTSRELVTSCEVISGDGHVLPPMVILPGIMHMEDWTSNTGLEDDVLMAVSETGYSNDMLCLGWLKHFEKFSRWRQGGLYRLLLLDGYGSHCTREFITFCDQKKIIPFCLPPHTTHLMQPLDVVVFQPLKHYHTEAIDRATRTGCSDFNKIEFLSALRSIRQQAFKSTTIVSAFRKTGLIPWNPDRVLSRIQQIQERQNSQNSLPRRPITPPHSIPPALSTPHTIRSLKRQAEYLDNAEPASPTFKKNLQRFIRGSLIQAETGAIVSQELGNTQAAQQARANRGRRIRRVVQNGGFLYASEARGIVSKNNEAGARLQLEKAERELERQQKKSRAERKKIWKPIFQELGKSKLRIGVIPRQTRRRRAR